MIEDLGLTGVALEVATEFVDAFPDAVLVSGKRDLGRQAEAMAERIMRNPKWIEQTYRAPLCAVAVACQAWVDGATRPLSQYGVTVGLYNVLIEFAPPDLRHLTRHLTGEAFDVRPVAGPRGDQMKARLHAKAAQVSGKFITEEGGEEIWHFQAP